MRRFDGGAATFGGYFYLHLTLYGQLVMKRQVSTVGYMRSSGAEEISFLITVLLKPWVPSGLLAGLPAALCWMSTLKRMSLGVYYPCVSLAFVGVTLLGAVVFGESLSVPSFVALGLLVASLTCLNLT